MDRLGVPFRVEDPKVDETPYQSSSEAPLEVARALASAKAMAVHSRHPEAIVIGSDQLVAFQKKILGKPGSREKACEQLAMLSGKEHELITAVAVIGPKGRKTHVDVTVLEMLPLPPEKISQYVDKDNPIDCAGSYKIEKGGIALFFRIDSEDFTAIEGLPLLSLAKLLREQGVSL